MMLRYETEDTLKLVVSRREKAGNFASKRREKAGNSLLVLVRTPCLSPRKSANLTPEISNQLQI